VYPLIATVLSCATARLPFSLAELAVGVLACVAVGLLVRTIRRRSWRILAEAGLRGLTIAAAAYLAFLVVWGLNYERLPYATSAGLDTRPASADELAALCRDLTDEANRAREGVAEDREGVVRLTDGPAGALARTPAGFQALDQISGGFTSRCARPKPVVASVLMSYLGISGIYFPFTGEPNVNVSVPDPELPFTASHELAHQRGYAREDEANYLASLACRAHPDRDFRYSGALLATLYASSALGSVDRDAVAEIRVLRSPGVSRDVEALAAWLRRFSGPIMDAAHDVNNAYLRSQGQRGGTLSYGRMVDLLIAERRKARRSSN
jgi:hypothetical protein